MEELLKAYQRFADCAVDEPVELLKGISYLEFVKENLCCKQALDEYRISLVRAAEENNITYLRFAALQMLELLSFLNDYTPVTKKVCEKACDSLAHTAEQRRNLYQELYNDIKIWKF